MTYFTYKLLEPWQLIINGLLENKIYNYEMKNKTYHTVGTVLKSDKNNSRKRQKIDTPNSQINDRSPYWLGTATTIKSGGAKLVL